MDHNVCSLQTKYIVLNNSIDQGLSGIFLNNIFLMKKILFLLLLLPVGLMVNAQAVYSFTFEDGVPTSQWIAAQGTFSVSEDHAMQGTKSLCWEIPSAATAEMTVSFTSFKTGSFSAFFHIYSLKRTANTMTVNFMDANSVVRKTANVSLDFKGWREFDRAYAKDFKSALSVDITKVRFTVNNVSGEPQKIFFDDVNFKATTNTSRQATDLMKFDLDVIESTSSALLTSYANTVDIEATTPTAEEIAGFNKVKANYNPTPAQAQASELRTVRTYINGLNITRNSDNTVKGNKIPSDAASLTAAFMIDITRKIEAIAYSAQTSESDKELFNDLLDHVIDQGFVYKYQRMTYSDYTTVRTLPKQLFNILPVCSEEQKVEVLNMINWIIEAGTIYASSEYLSTHMNSDYMYLYFGYLCNFAVHQIDMSKSVRELKALSRFIERSLQFTDGSYETLKRDGTGFHHNAHYNGYMYALNSWVDVSYNLKGTVFRISRQAYDNLKLSCISMYLTSNRGGDGSNYFANSLAGRHPFYGTKANFSRGSIERMIEIGGDIMGKTIDEELAAAYNYFFGSTTYDVTPGNYDGYYQFNYSPMGVYRKDNWVVTMRAPTTKFWGAEIYSTTNRFGRYQSHGALEVVYDGTLPQSGFPSPSAELVKGWDWNVVPGTTTVHYTSWQEMMPNRNTTDRFDQYTKTKNFAGALAWGDCGIFTSDFDQGDNWGSQRYTPTNLEFKKSVFAFDGMLVSIGTDIKSSGSYSDNMITATNLFQSMKTSSTKGNLNINGTVMNAGDADITKTSNENFWMITPEGTGYYLPKGNDNIIIKHAEQAGPLPSGADYSNPSKAVAAKAYINHGVKPADKSYMFVVVPATTQADMQQLAQKFGDAGGDLFEVKSRDSKLHALLHKTSGTMAYTFFEAVDNISFGVVSEAGSEMLLMQRALDDTRLSFAVANPNLRPVSDGNKWISSKTETHIVVEGKWYEDKAITGVTVNTPANGKTRVDIDLTYGEAIYFKLRPSGYVSVPSVSNSNGVSIFANTDTKEVVVEFTEAQIEDVTVEVFSVDGIKVRSSRYPAGNKTIRFAMDEDAFRQVYIVRVSSDSGWAKSAKCFI